ncbi:hypothetical protein M422DRAFT_26007 [Sphaerobolus stellatus SS14]|nr:hypothetical protein M422DRAFT_26007 [Sphaerobolus stellatus SS14]
MGVSTAFYLSKDEGVKDGSVTVTILEANAIASGASGKAGGFLALDWHGPGTASLARLSFRLHQQLAQEFNGTETYGYGKLRSFNLSKSAQVPEDMAIHQFRPGPSRSGRKPPDTEWLKDFQVETLEVISEEMTTAQIIPGLFSKKLFEEAQAANVKLIIGKPISWNEEDNLLTISTPEGERNIPCNKLLITAGPWSARVVKQLFNLDVPVSNLPGHSIIVRPSAPLPAQAVFARIYGENMTLTPELWRRSNGLVYVAGENTGAPLPEGTADVEVDPAAIEKLVNASHQISSLLAQGTVVAEQLCYRPITRHGTPLLGLLKNGPGNTRAYLAAGHGPWGITLGPGTGKVMAELILRGYAISADISRLAPSQYLQQ